MKLYVFICVIAFLFIFKLHLNPVTYIYLQILQDLLLGDPSKAKQQLGWVPRVSFDQLVRDMVDADMELMKRNPEA